MQTERQTEYFVCLLVAGETVLDQPGSMFEITQTKTEKKEKGHNQ